MSKSKFINIPGSIDHRGKLNFLEFDKLLNFPVKRIYYISAVPNKITRGFHAHLELQQCFICISGSCEISIENRYEKLDFILDDNSKGFIMPPLTWRTFRNMTPETILLVLASTNYNHDDYISDYEKFIKDYM